MAGRTQRASSASASATARTTQKTAQLISYVITSRKKTKKDTANLPPERLTRRSCFPRTITTETTCWMHLYCNIRCQNGLGTECTWPQRSLFHNNQEATAQLSTDKTTVAATSYCTTDSERLHCCHPVWEMMPQNCPWGDSGHHLIHRSLGTHVSTSQTASQSAQPF